MTRPSLAVIEDRLRRTAGASLDSPTKRREMVHELRRLVPFDAWCWSTIDPVSLLVSSVVADNPALTRLESFFLLEAADQTANGQAAITGAPSGVRTLHQATRGDLRRSRRWLEVYSVGGAGDELRVPLHNGPACWGLIDLLREHGARPFSHDEALLIQRLAPLLASTTRGLQAVRPARGAAPNEGAATVVLNASLAVIATTAEADRWMSAMRLSSGGRPGAPPVPVLAAAARVASGPAADGETRSARVRTRLGTGQLLIVSAAALVSSTLQRSIAVTIEPAAPDDVTALMLLAYRLSPRQRELVGLLLQGCSTKEMALRLRISQHTVNDHVKAVLDRFNVNTRAQLVATVTRHIDTGNHLSVRT